MTCSLVGVDIFFLIVFSHLHCMEPTSSFFPWETLGVDAVRRQLAYRRVTDELRMVLQASYQMEQMSEVFCHELNAHRIAKST